MESEGEVQVLLVNNVETGRDRDYVRGLKSSQVTGQSRTEENLH